MKVVISGKDMKEPLSEAYTESGVLVNSGEFNGMKNNEAKKPSLNGLSTKGLVNLKLNTDYVIG